MLTDFIRHVSWWLLLVCVPLLLAAGIPPLDDVQRVKLETTDQRSRTVDEAAFYALIENARDWPDEPTISAAGDEEVVVADLAKIEANPAAWQGRLVLVEGRLEALMPAHKWARSGFGDVKGINVRVGQEPVIVYLSDPPPLRIARGARTLAEQGARVKIVARFFKLVEQPSERAGEKLYPVFVGRQIMSMDTGGTGRGFPGGAMMPLLAVAVAGCIFLLYHRVRRMGHRNRGGMTMAEYHARKERQRQPAAAPPPEAVEETQSGLPDDPAAALDAMSDDRRRPQ